MATNLLTPEGFVSEVKQRDHFKCVCCDHEDVNAHHLISSQLYDDGGHYLNNGALLCHDCTQKALSTELSVETIASNAGIEIVKYPDHVVTGDVIDHWGNTVLPNGQRMCGVLFDDENAQEHLKRGNALDLFTSLRKYPRTFHFDWSDGVASDDKIIRSISGMNGKRIIGTIKMDGENTTLYRDHIHARSIDSKHHRSRDEVKAFWSMIAHDIPDRWRVCGENLYAQHSIKYNNLKHVFYGFSIWDHRNIALPWDEGSDNTIEWFSMLGITPVEKVYDDIFDEDEMKRVAQTVIDNGDEGVVFRIADEIPYNKFDSSVAKVVRKGHVQTETHWMHSEIKRNGIIDNNASSIKP